MSYKGFPTNVAEEARSSSGSNWRKPSSLESAYEEARAFLGGKGSKKIAPNTFLIQGRDDVHVDFHGYTIVEYHPGSMRLSSHGYRTYTTKERINWFLPEHYGLWQESHEWFVSTPDGKIPFEDGMTISGRAAREDRPHHGMREQVGLREESRAMTNARAQLAPYGMMIRKTGSDGEVRVYFKGERDPDAGYFTDDLDDAIRTGIAMAQQAERHPEHHHRPAPTAPPAHERRRLSPQPLPPQRRRAPSRRR